MSLKIGVAITTHNEFNQLKNCIESLIKITNPLLHIEVVDDGSTDGTIELTEFYKTKIHTTRGNGQLWWAGGTNAAIVQCLNAGCDFVLLVNSDVIITEKALNCLLSTADDYFPAIVASVVVEHSNPDSVWWAGSKWGPILKNIPVWANKYLYKRGISVNNLPCQPYETSEAHGRGVLIPKVIFEHVGFFNQKAFPHYGADTDFSFRVNKAGYKIIVQPNSVVYLNVKNTGLHKNDRPLTNPFINYYHYLFKRKNGEAVRVWWLITMKHLRFPVSLFSFLFCIALNTFRFWYSWIIKRDN
jgi:GT2 family glycosyltransferase